ncbi:MAG: alpha-galactosidase [Faecalicoccus sp.]|nr:alpha-galactosidase [Faecalicoccus sp.]
MTVLYDANHQTFTIHTKNSTYQMQVDQYNHLIHLYYGKRTEGCMDYLLAFVDRGFSGNPYEAGIDRTYSLDYLPQEFPTQGTGDFRSPALIVRDDKGTFGCHLRYKGYSIDKGKYSLKGLPAVYADQDRAQSLTIEMMDDRLGLSVKLLYGVIDDLDIITRSVIVTNQGEHTCTLERLYSANLDFVYGHYDLMTFYGRHMMERQVNRTHVEHGTIGISSRRGMSSHQYNPFVILSDQDTTETSGRCWAMQFVYSGGFKAEVEKDQYNQCRLQMGIEDEMFSYQLEPQESIIGPEVILSFSDSGFEDLSDHLHQNIRKHICRGKYRDISRPVLLNSWEAFYFSFTGQDILSLAKEAKSLGIDLVVMDDGWFGRRNSDYCALGDWTPNEDKLGCSLKELAAKINEMGVKFGIWMEPEMISEDSDLYRNHPDWVMMIPNEKPVCARSQLVLDFSRQEVCDYIFERICDILDTGNIEYIKWDYNRSIADVFSYSTKDQGKVLYKYILGLYDVLERLIERYPDVLMEGCAGGGGRFDAGMLYYMPQIWCSDNTDVLDRLQIQYGTSFGYPASTIGSHVSAVPNHQTGRTSLLSTRGAAANYGGFGYELNPKLLSEQDKKEIRKQIDHHKKTAHLIHEGKYIRLSNPGVDPICAWEFVSRDRKEAMIQVVIPYNHGNSPTLYCVPRGLAPNSLYLCREDGKQYPSDALMDSGFPLPVIKEDGESFVFHLEKVEL